jgi:hypothetical protein
MSSYILSEEWNLWFHSIDDKNWKKNSYKKLLTLKSLFDYQLINDTFKKNHYQNGMFFCMRKHIFPNWEDPYNRNGGCLSFKIASNDIIEIWNKILINCVNNCILKDKNEEITGISISPKKEFNIIKIWFVKDTPSIYKGDFDINNSKLSLDKSVFRAHAI